MEITTKGRYAVRVLADIARQNDSFVSLSDVSERQGISVKYLEKIVSLLSKADLVESMRGANGGYKLTKSASNISVKDVLNATGDNVKVSTCLEEVTCPKAEKCDTIGVWAKLNDIVNNYLESVSIQDLIDQTCDRHVVK